jgi:uncharacterized delta-60 repeat protein
MVTQKWTCFGITLIVLCALSLTFSFAGRGLAGEAQVSQETTRTFLPLLIRGYSYREPAGILDPAFNGSGIVVTDFSQKIDIAYAVTLQPDGKLLAAGKADGLGFALARYHPDGSLDLTFGVDGKTTTSLGSDPIKQYVAGNAIALQRDGKILVAGIAGHDNDDIGLARFTSDGSPDTSFGAGNGWVVTDLGVSEEAQDLVLQPDGKIVVVGAYFNDVADDWDFALLRYNSDGSLDTSFDEDGWLTTDFDSSQDVGEGVVLQSDGKIIVAGTSLAGMALARYNPDGSLDTDFGLGGRVTLLIGGTTTSYAIALTYDEKILVAGSAQTIGTYDFALARFNADGSPDTSFGAGSGWVVTDFDNHYDLAQEIALQPDGKIVLAGQSLEWEVDQYLGDFALARFNADGSLDTSFGDAGRVTTDLGSPVDYAYSLLLQLDGKIVVAGRTATTDENWDFALARYK